MRFNPKARLDTSRPITLGGGSTFTADDPSWSYLDIGDVHYNANGKGYAQMHAAHPERPMTHSEGFPATIHQDTEFSAGNAWAVGTWVWAAMDYLGESGIGKTLIPGQGILMRLLVVLAYTPFIFHLSHFKHRIITAVTGCAVFALFDGNGTFFIVSHKNTSPHFSFYNTSAPLPKP